MPGCRSCASRPKAVKRVKRAQHRIASPSIGWQAPALDCKHQRWIASANQHTARMVTEDTHHSRRRVCGVRVCVWGGVRRWRSGQNQAQAKNIAAGPTAPHHPQPPTAHATHTPPPTTHSHPLPPNTHDQQSKSSPSQACLRVGRQHVGQDVRVVVEPVKVLPEHRLSVCPPNRTQRKCANQHDTSCSVMSTRCGSVRRHWWQRPKKRRTKFKNDVIVPLPRGPPPRRLRAARA